MTNGKKTLVITFRCDHEVYDLIADQAKRSNWSIAHTVLNLVKLGLLYQVDLAFADSEQDDEPSSDPCFGCDRDACYGCPMLHPSLEVFDND